MSKKWTGNEKATFLLGLASLGLACAAFAQSMLSRDMSNAVDRLTKVADETQKQTVTLGKQVVALNGQLAEQKTQTNHLSEQARAATASATSSQRSVRIAQLQLATSQATLRESKYEAAARIKYEARLESAKTYLAAQASYETVLWQIRNRLPFDIENPTEVNNLTLVDLNRLREVVDPVIAARREYDGNYRAALAPWPEDIRALLIDAATHADFVSGCFEHASMVALNEGEATQLKQNINNGCRNLGYQHQAFVEASKEVEDAMINELYNAVLALGFDPEVLTPRQRRK